MSLKSNWHKNPYGGGCYGSWDKRFHYLKVTPRPDGRTEQQLVWISFSVRKCACDGMPVTFSHKEKGDYYVVTATQGPVSQNILAISYRSSKMWDGVRYVDSIMRRVLESPVTRE